jgi:hypothetical protein
MLYLPDDQVKLRVNLKFSPSSGHHPLHGMEIVIPKGTPGTLLRRLNGKQWVVLVDTPYKGSSLRIGEDRFELASLLETIAREVDDADYGP